MEFGTVRIVGSVCIILGCFCFLYPKLIHPVILTVFGLAPKEAPKANNEFPGPQHMRDGPPVHPGHHPHDARGVPGDMRQHMRGGPHPGMRAAAAENARQQQTKGSGRGGMMGVILPMYAVGIVVYLIYTLMKVFNKKDKKERDRDPQRDVSPGHSGLEQRTITDDEENDMRLLQQRLAETEAQMTKILQAMKTVQAKVVPEQGQEGESVASGELGETSQQNTSNNSGDAGERKMEEQGLNSSDVSNGSSQDTESYEVIGKSDKEGSADEASPIVETVGPKVDVGLRDLDAVDDDDDYEGDGEEEEGADADSEGEDILIESKQPSDDDAEITVRKRTTKTGDTDS